MGFFDHSTFFFVFALVFVVCIAIFGFTLFMIFSPKLRAKWMGRQVKAAKYMLDENKENLADIASVASEVSIHAKKKVLDSNEKTLKEMATREANIHKDSVTVMAKAIKDGFSDSSIYCKHCGKSVDSDSTFCKHCGGKIS